LRIQECRVCGSRQLDPVLDRATPPARPPVAAPRARPDAAAGTSPGLVFCRGCALLQASAALPADLLLRLPPLLAARSPARVRAAADAARALVGRHRLAPGALVLAIGSNDGTLLRPFAAAGLEVLGIELAEAPARRAAEAGIPTLRAFFGEELATVLARQGKAADLVLAGGALGRAPDLDDLVAGIARLLKPEGGVFLSFASVLAATDADERVREDRVFHHSLTSLARLLARHGLHLNDADAPGRDGRTAAHASLATGRSAALARLLEEEEARGVADPALYRALFAAAPAEDAPALLADDERRPSPFPVAAAAAGERVARPPALPAG
jgi:SAM-dependent methyltransferase